MPFIRQRNSSKSDDAAARRPRYFAASVLCGLLLAVSVQAQETPTGPAAAPQTEPVPAEAPLPPNRPGFLDALGRWIGGSTDAIGSGIRSTQDTIGNLGSQATGVARDAAGIATDAAGSVVAIPGTRMISGRQLCPLASNAAPDCQQGAELLCRNKGFKTGRSLDVMTGQRCSVQAWLSGGARKEADCRTETFVTRAMCQ